MFNFFTFYLYIFYCFLFASRVFFVTLKLIFLESILVLKKEDGEFYDSFVSTCFGLLTGPILVVFLSFLKRGKRDI